MAQGYLLLKKIMNIHYPITNYAGTRKWLNNKKARQNEQDLYANDDVSFSIFNYFFQRTTVT